MRINLGCGDRYADGWHNVDHAGSPHRKDEAVDLTCPLPWPPGSVTHVYAGHVLEHLRVPDVDQLLLRLRAVMVPGGQIMVVGPDVDRAGRMIADGTFDYSWGHTLDSIRFGGSRWPGDAHFWDCTGPQVARALRVAGWSDVTDVGIEHVPDFWPVADRAPLWQCAVSAVAPTVRLEYVTPESRA